MLRTLFSLHLFLSLFCLAHAKALAVSLERDNAISFQATMNQPFAVDLAAKVKAIGTYSIVNSTSWLQLSNEGILFGTPTEENLGMHKVFVSVMNKDSELLFRVNVNVVKDPSTPNFNYSYKVGQIVKINVAALTGIKGKYEFIGLPQWLEGTEAGILIGMPEKVDVGDYQIDFSVTGAEKVLKSRLHIEVEEKAAPPSSNAFVAQVGVPTAINIKHLAKVAGDYQVVHAPSWLVYTVDGWLQGTLSEKDLGESFVSFVVTTPSHTKVRYSFRTLVVEE